MDRKVSIVGRLGGVLAVLSFPTVVALSFLFFLPPEDDRPTLAHHGGAGESQESQAGAKNLADSAPAMPNTATAAKQAAPTDAETSAVAADFPRGSLGFEELPQKVTRKLTIIECLPPLTDGKGPAAVPLVLPPPKDAKASPLPTDERQPEEIPLDRQLESTPPF
jgi:hypothetical protein